MKPESVRTTLSTAVLSWLLALSTVGCIATAFDFSLAQGLGNLAAVSGLFALAVAFAFRYFSLAAPATLLLAAQMLVLFDLRQQPLQLYFLLPQMTQRYHNAYGWPILLDNPDGATQADLALLRLALVLCFFLCWTLFRRKNLVLTLLPLTPILGCVVVYDTVPNATLLCLFLLGLLLLLLTHRLRRQDKTGDWSRQGIKLMPVTALLLAMLLVVVPQSNKLNPLRSAVNQLLPWIDGLFSDNLAGGGSSSGGVVGPSTAPGINLSTLGPKTQSNDVVLYYSSTSRHNQLVYLRHRVMAYYTGTAWSISRSVGQSFGQKITGSKESISIRTTSGNRYFYVPYFPTTPVLFSSGIAASDYAVTQYSYYFTDSFRVTLQDTLDNDIYHDLPDSTRDWAEDLVASIIGDATDTATKAKRIGDYVRNSATYSLNTLAMPSYSSDFAKWFLEDGDTGYCVHFATAATVLLRAAGIPAQYVEGLTFMSSDTEIPVHSSNAHAWVEYYDENNYCHILDPTPADGIPDDPYDPDAPDDPDTPDTPDTPDDPDDPDDPDTPDTPDNPDEPDTPDEPAQPDTPDLPNMTPDDYLSQVRLDRLLGTLAGAAVLLLIAQALLRRRAHRRRWHEGEHNARALERYRQCCRLAKICKMSVPEALTDIAGKARFSQHQITEEELAQFDAFWQAANFAAKATPPHRKLMRFFIAAL